MMRITVIILLIFALTACSRTEQVQTLTGFAQGTTWHISVWRPGGIDAQALQTQIEAEFARLDQSLSNYREDSFIEQSTSSLLRRQWKLGLKLSPSCKPPGRLARPVRAAMT
jgi:thiamine biosynthesis lipoprotein ApbE